MQGVTGDQGPTGMQGASFVTPTGPTGAFLYYDGADVQLNSNFVYNNNNFNISGNLIPNSDAYYSLGQTGSRWSEIFVGHGTINIAGPVGSTANGTIGTDDNSIVYTSSGFATPFINIGPSVTAINAGDIGGWVIAPTGAQFSPEYDLVVTQKGINAAFPAGITGPQYSLLLHPTPPNITLTKITDTDGSTGTNGSVLSNIDGYVRWSTNAGPTGAMGEQSTVAGPTGPTGPSIDYITNTGDVSGTLNMAGYGIINCSSINLNGYPLTINNSTGTTNINGNTNMSHLNISTIAINSSHGVVGSILTSQGSNQIPIWTNMSYNTTLFPSKQALGHVVLDYIHMPTVVITAINNNDDVRIVITNVSNKGFNWSTHGAGSPINGISWLSIGI
jgi:hypothetical protein